MFLFFLLQDWIIGFYFLVSFRFETAACHFFEQAYSKETVHHTAAFAAAAHNKIFGNKFQIVGQ